jgi:ferredoxin
MKYQKIIIPTVLVSSSLLVLYGFKTKFLNSSTTTSSNSQNSSSIKSSDKITSDIVYQKLSVLSNRCRGCGKCVRIDPEHFEMSGQVAIVTSSNNLNSPSLAMAINNCPGQAIALK